MADITRPSTDTAVHLYLDCETIPTQDAALIAEIEAKFPAPVLDLGSVRPDGRLKSPFSMKQGKKESDEDFAASVQAAQAAIDQDMEAKRTKIILEWGVAQDRREQDIDAAYRKTSLDGTTGHIACIYHNFNDDPIAGTSNDALKNFKFAKIAVGGNAGDGVRIRPGHSMVVNEERAMLERFFRIVEFEVARLSKERFEAQASANKRFYGEFYKELADKGLVTLPPVIVAHHAQFDLRFIWQRAIVLGVPVPAWWPHDAKAWDTTKVQDTMVLWAGVGQRIGLDRLCRALGIEGKGDIDGSKVWDAVRDGRIAEVAEYCGDDVERLRSVHRRIMGWPAIPTADEVYEAEVAAELDEADAIRRSEQGDF